MTKKLLVFLFMSFLFVYPAFAGSGGIININSIVRIGGDVVIPRGQVVNQVVAIAGDVVIDGVVMGDVVAIGSSVNLSEGAVVHGNVSSVGGTIEKALSSSIKGDSVAFSIPVVDINERNVFSTAGLGNKQEILKGLSSLAFIIVSIIISLIFTVQIGTASHAIEKNPGLNFIMGILGVLLIPSILFLLGVTIVGIPLLPYFVLVVVVNLIFGLVVISQLLGKKALGLFRLYGQPMPLEVIIGLILIILLGSAPYCGWIFKCLFVITGLGAAIHTRLGQQQI